MPVDPYLVHRARQLGLKGDRYRAYVYGTQRRIETARARKHRKGGDKIMATRRRTHSHTHRHGAGHHSSRKTRRRRSYAVTSYARRRRLPPRNKFGQFRRRRRG